MSEDTTSFWGLRRRIPRFVDVPHVTVFEGLGIGALIGSLLIGLGYVAQVFYFEQWQQAHPFTPADYLRVAAWIFGGALAVGLLLWALMRFSSREDRTDSDAPFRVLRTCVLLIRERHRVWRLDALLLIVPLAVAFGVWLWQDTVPWDYYREWPLGVAAVCTCVLLLLFRRNPFIPSARSLEIPDWVDDLIRQTTAQEPADPAHRQRRAFCLQHGVMDIDDCVDAASYFRYPLADELPPEFREVAVQVSSGVKEQMAEFLAQHGGAYYQEDHFQGTVRMLDPLNGALAGVGVLELKRLIAQIVTRARHANWSRFKLAEVILAFVQRVIAYEHDAHGTGHDEYGRFPLQTLVDGKGDCECTALLCCALLSYLDYHTALVLVRTTDGTAHAASLLQPPSTLPAFYDESHLLKAEGQGWLYGETSLDDGTLPWLPSQPASVESIDRIVPIPPRPL